MDKFNAIMQGASIAVSILANEDATDIEMLPVLPRAYGAEVVEELAARWSAEGRNLRFIGAIALVDGRPKTALAEPLDLRRMNALAEAFNAYVESLLSGAIAEQPQERRDLVYDWKNQRYVYE